MSLQRWNVTNTLVYCVRRIVKVPWATVEGRNSSNDGLDMPSIYKTLKLVIGFNVYYKATYRMVVVPFGWRSQYSGRDGSIHGCSLNKEAHVLQHDQNSPPFCSSQLSAEERVKQTALVIIKLLPFMLWSITVLPPTERRAVSIRCTKECIQLCVPCFYSKYI